MDTRYVVWLTRDWQLAQAGLGRSGGVGYVNGGECDRATNQFVGDADGCEIAVRWALSFNNKGQLYILGDEPDLYGVEPADYLAWYSKYRAMLKEADPTCKVSIAGISQVHGLGYLNQLYAIGFETDQLRCHAFDWWDDNLATWKSYINSWLVWRDVHMPTVPVAIGSFGYPGSNQPDQAQVILDKMTAALNWLQGIASICQWYWWEWDAAKFGEPNCLWKDGQLTPCGELWTSRATG